MNYLSHYVFNHRVCELPADSWFATGVALPDLWPRFSRRRRIRWNHVRASRPADKADGALRRGLLNHVAVDQRFHSLPSFLGWQRELKRDTPADAGPPLLIDFVTHVAIELALDHHLVRQEPDLVAEFYEHLATCEDAAFEPRVGRVANVDASGLCDVIRGFLIRRFLYQYAHVEGMVVVMEHVLEHVRVAGTVASDAIHRIIAQATTLADPQRVWKELGRDLVIT